LERAELAAEVTGGWLSGRESRRTQGAHEGDEPLRLIGADSSPPGRHQRPLSVQYAGDHFQVVVDPMPLAT
jgi:hypothetical protein